MNIKRKSLNILIRTAGGKETNQELGLGHIYRSLNLAKELRPNKIDFLLEDFGGAKKIIEESGFTNIKKIKKNIELEKDIQITKKYLEEKEINILIVDRYHVRKNYLKKIQKYVKLIVISDLMNIEYRADLVVSGFIGLENQIKINSHNSKCLLGPKYQILNKKFSKKNKIKKENYDLLVTLGGYDGKNSIDAILKYIQPYISEIKTKIIVGPIGRKSKMVNNFERKYSKTLKVIKFTKNMKYEIENAKFGICGGGITSYEFASMNKPFGIICVEKHQLQTAKQWEKKGYAVNFGLRIKSTEINKFLQNIAKNKLPFGIKDRKLVDGKGSLRVAQEILKIR